jgi:catechol 2,3-dioxygenase-like lactoylglutathione lyase family enzyme
MRIEHTAWNVSEPAAMAQWYIKHLGLKLVKQQTEPPFIHFLSDDRGAMVEIYHNPAGPVLDYKPMHPVTLHIAFTVADIEGERKRLIDAGATPVGEIATTPGGDQLAFLKDPWSFTVQLVKRKTPMV